MAEVLGTIASLITIAQTLEPVLSLARTIYKAQKELKDVQTDLAELTEFLEAIKYRNPNRFSPHLQSALCTSRQTIGELKAVIQDKLLRSDNGNVRPVSWLIHKKKVEVLQSRLRESKQRVLAAVSMETLETSVRSDATLLDIFAQTRAILGILNRVDEVWMQDYQPSDNMRPSHRRMIDTVSASVTKCVFKDPFSDTTDMSESEVKQHKDKLFELGRQTTPLEHFPNDYPEMYSKSMLPKVIITALFEETSSRFSRTNYYRMLFQKSPRQWIHLDISLEIPSDSKYWTVTALHSDPKYGFLQTHMKAFGVPTSLLEVMQQGFARHMPKITEYSHLRFWLSNESPEGTVVPRMEQSALIRPGLKEPHVPTECSKEAILSSLHHLGCRKVSTGQVIQLAPLEISHHFMSIFEGRLVEEVRSHQQPPTAEFCYNIEILHYLRNEPGIVRLLGLAVDDVQHDLQSYLVKLPETECEFLLDYASRLAQSWNWSQIENLAWQLIHRISSVHTAGRHFVVGTLWMLRPPILVDALGQLHLYRFNNTLDFRALALPFYPPEFRTYAKVSHLDSERTKRPPITKEFDIYQLGQLLWVLVESWATDRSAQSLKETLYRNLRLCQVGIYSHYATLPRLSEKIPEYFRLIVEECSAESPYARPRAVELLSRFPSARFDLIAGIQGVQSGSSPPSMDVNAFQKCRVRSVSCDICGAQITSITYNCAICDCGDFDLCQECFDKKIHCYDPSHLLRESPVCVLFSDITRYHSSVDSLGARHITEL